MRRATAAWLLTLCVSLCVFLSGGLAEAQEPSAAIENGAADGASVATSGPVDSGPAASTKLDDRYSADQLLDGFLAIFVGVGEPLYFRPKIWLERCSDSEDLRSTIALAPLCYVIGVTEGLFFTLFDSTTGLLDIATFGYFEISRSSGVFDYFEEEAERQELPPTVTGPEPFDPEDGYTRY